MANYSFLTTPFVTSRMCGTFVDIRTSPLSSPATSPSEPIAVAKRSKMHHQASQLVGTTRFEFDGFLKARGIYDRAYSIEDFEQDLATLRELESKDLLRRPCLTW